MKKLFGIALIICLVLVNIPVVFAGFTEDDTNIVTVDLNSILAEQEDGTVVYSDNVDKITDILGESWSLYSGDTPSSADVISVKEIDGKKYLNISATGKGTSCGIVKTVSPEVSADGRYVAEIEYYGGDTYTANVYTTLSDASGNNIVTMYKDSSNYFRIQVGNGEVQNMYRSKNVIGTYNMKFTVDVKKGTLDIDLNFEGGGKASWADEDEKLTAKIVDGVYNVTRSEPYTLEMVDGGIAVPGSFTMYVTPSHATAVRPASLSFVKITPYTYVKTTCIGAFRENGEKLETVTTKEKIIKLCFDDAMDTSFLNDDNVKIYDEYNYEVEYTYDISKDKKSYIITLGTMPVGDYKLVYSNLRDANEFAIDGGTIDFAVEQATQLNVSKDSIQVSNSSEEEGVSEIVKFDHQSGMTVVEYTWKSAGQPTTAQRTGTKLMSGDNVIMDIYSTYRQINIVIDGKIYTVPSSAVVFYTGTYSLKAVIDNRNHIADVILTNPNVVSYVMGTNADFENTFVVDKDANTITLKNVAIPEYEIDKLDFYINKLTAEGKCTTDITDLKIYEPSVLQTVSTYSGVEIEYGGRGSMLMKYIDFTFDYPVKSGAVVTVNGKKTETEMVESNVLRVNLPELEALKKYSLVFENVTDNNGNNVIGLEDGFTFTTTKSALTAEFTDVIGAGNFTLKINNEYSDDKSVVIMCVLYSADGRLKAQPQIMHETIPAVTGKIFENIGFTLPQNVTAGDFVKIMVWDGEDTMHPLASPAKIIVQ